MNEFTEDIVCSDPLLRPVYTDRHGNVWKDEAAVYIDLKENGQKVVDSHRGLPFLIRLITREIFWPEMGVSSGATDEQIDEYFKSVTEEKRKIIVEWSRCLLSGPMLDTFYWYIMKRSDDELLNIWPSLIPLPIDNEQALSIIIVTVTAIASCSHFLKAPYAEQWALICGRNSTQLFDKIHRGEVKLSLKLKDENPSLCLTLRSYDIDVIFGQKKLKSELKVLDDETPDEEKSIVGPSTYNEKYAAICRKYGGEKRRIESDGRQLSKMYHRDIQAKDVMICEI